MCTEFLYKKLVEDTRVIKKNNKYYLKNFPNIPPYKSRKEALRVSEGLRNAIQF